jgi:uncharacterized protein HemX
VNLEPAAAGLGGVQVGYGMEGLNAWGGIFAGIVALLAAIGGGIKCSVHWTERREDSRSKKLQAWHDELERREQRLEAERENEIHEIKTELGKMRAENRALFHSCHLVTQALAKIDPGNRALRDASMILTAAFGLDGSLPADMLEILGRIK